MFFFSGNLRISVVSTFNFVSLLEQNSFQFHRLYNSVIHIMERVGKIAQWLRALATLVEDES